MASGCGRPVGSSYVPFSPRPQLLANFFFFFFFTLQGIEIFSCTIDVGTFACGLALLFDGVNLEAIGFFMLAINALSIIVQLVAMASQSASAVYAGAVALFGCGGSESTVKVHSLPVLAMVSNDGYADLDKVKAALGGRTLLRGPLRAEFPDRLPRTRLSSHPIPATEVPRVRRGPPSRHHTLVIQHFIRDTFKP